MRAGTCVVLSSLLGALALAPAPVAADDAAPEAAPAATAALPDTWLGGLAAVGCGIFVRASIVTAGTQVGIIAGAIACCAYAVVDLVFIDPN